MYDKLALTVVDGDLLADIYLQSRRSLADPAARAVRRRKSRNLKYAKQMQHVMTRTGSASTYARSGPRWARSATGDTRISGKTSTTRS